jgi:hypothetical protein
MLRKEQEVSSVPSLSFSLLSFTTNIFYLNRAWRIKKRRLNRYALSTHHYFTKLMFLFRTITQDFALFTHRTRVHKYANTACCVPRLCVVWRRATRKVIPLSPPPLFPFLTLTFGIGIYIRRQKIQEVGWIRVKVFFYY